MDEPTTEHLLMSTKEINRVPILDRLIAKEIKQKHAAKLLGVSTRQIRRMKKAYQESGVAGLVHQGRGKASNRKTKQSEIDRAMKIVKQQYHDFGPTLAHEKLVNEHGINFSVERLRQAMIAEKLWKPKCKRKPRVHQMRQRRECEGELVQVDGSPHDWFEGRGEVGVCTLLVYIDDATGKLKHMRFVESESTWSYFTATKEYLLLHGKPLAFYLDKHGVFRVNSRHGGSADVNDSTGVTQFGRAMQELKIELIFANSPQAKGRVERANQTLQDRLVKELRLRGISELETANEYLPEFMEYYNRKFSVVPQSQTNLHRPVSESEELKEIFTKQMTRILSKNLTLQYQNKLYQVLTKRPGYAMRQAPVVVKEYLSGQLSINYKGQQLKYEILEHQPKMEVMDSKEVNPKVNRIKIGSSWKPPADHPWRNFSIADR